MAVKQNNTEANGGGAPATVGTGSAAKGTTSGGVGSNGSSHGAPTQIQKINPNIESILIDAGDYSGTSTTEQPCCSVVNNTASKTKLGGSPTAVMAGIGAVTDVCDGTTGGGMMPSNDIAYILHIIHHVELQKRQAPLVHVYVYKSLIEHLSRVPLPRQSAEELKRFKDDIRKVGEFFATDKRMYVVYLHLVCQLLTDTGGSEPPSCAIAVIFQLFSPEMVFDAVQSLLVKKISDRDIKRTVRLLCEWLRTCNFCKNLNMWIIAILKVLQDQQKLTLYTEIALENVDQLFKLLILPVLRPKVAPIVLIMLMSIDHTQDVFHKILPKFPFVLNCLKQQSRSEDHARETTKFMHELMDHTRVLMVRFYGYDDLYAPIESALKEFGQSLSCLSLSQDIKGRSDMSTDVMLHSSNAKVGLVNLGNTCYMNSVLQALAMTKEFTRGILMSDSNSPLVVKLQQQIALMLYSMRYELTPSRVLNATRPPGFAPGVQQDSSEFLGYLLETLHNQEMSHRMLTTAIRQEYKQSTMRSPTLRSGDMPLTLEVNETIQNTHPADNRVYETNLCSFTPVTQPSQLSSGDVNSNLDVANKATAATGLNGQATVPSTVENTFTGQLATTYKCLTCGWKSRNVDHFREFQLSFPEMKSDCVSNYSVQDLIDYYCSPEKLSGDNQYFCERCQRLSDAERYMNVISAPKNLILTLKHFKYDQRYHMRAKLMHKVFHDEKVSVKVCSAETLGEMAIVHYDLYAGVVHSGFSMDSGHYYTYASDASNKWYKFNDNIVTSSRSEELHNLTPPNTPYILFYQICAQSNEPTEDIGRCASNNKVIKVEVPSPLLLEELPLELREYVNRDNSNFKEELKQRLCINANAATTQSALLTKGNKRGGGGYHDEDEDDQPPPTSGCGGNAMNINVNRFVF